VRCRRSLRTPYPAGGANGGHWAAFIQVGDEILFASPHERRYVDAAVEMGLALAEELESGAEDEGRNPVTSSEGLPSATG
jgi:hypothetical protein